MNRVIKFRGKSEVGGIVGIKKHDWVYGGITYDDDRVWIDILYFGQILVDKETIGQYTGLHDKNGKEIYEGDILKIPEWLMQDCQDKCLCIYGEEHQTSEIIGFGLYIEDRYSGEYKILVPSDEWDEFEVIGNIYDNPELLEKG